MKVITQSSEILYPATETTWAFELNLIELAGRTAYKSEEKRTADSAKPFIQGIVKRNHLAVIEFGNMVVKFTTDRGITHELVRHRLCSFIQESTRYCNYGSGNFGGEITVVKPSTWDEMAETQRERWHQACREAEIAYLGMLEVGLSPQQARSVLPNSTKAEIVIKANFRFQIRAVEKAAHPDMRALLIPLYNTVRTICPEVFDMGDPQ